MKRHFIHIGPDGILYLTFEEHRGQKHKYLTLSLDSIIHGKAREQLEIAMDESKKAVEEAFLNG